MTREEFLDATFPPKLAVASRTKQDEERAKGSSTLTKAMLS